ncbi:MAG: RNA polymerase sigma factor [Deltaproteobacteria bacterium]
MPRRLDFEAQLLPHLDRIYDVALRLCGSRDEADDLSQETVLRAREALHSLPSGARLLPWLLTVQRHLFLNRRRAERRHPIVALEEAGLSHDPWAEEGPAPWEELGRDDIARAVSQLPERLRSAVDLRDLQGLSYREVAGVLDVPVGTVMSRLYRGRAELRRLLFGALSQRGPGRRSLP